MDVTFRNVSVSIAGAQIISDIHLNVAAGGFVGIVGPNGSGKSTTLRCLYRALTPASGDVAVNGVSVRAISMRENARQVAALTQDMSLDFDFTAAEVIATGRLPHGALTAWHFPAGQADLRTGHRDRGRDGTERPHIRFTFGW